MGLENVNIEDILWKNRSDLKHETPAYFDWEGQDIKARSTSALKINLTSPLGETSLIP